MDKNCNKQMDKKTNSRTEFAQEYSIDTNKTNKQSGKTNKRSHKMDKKSNENN